MLVRAYPVSLDPAAARDRSPKTREVKTIRKEIGAWRGDAKLLLRVDRLELSKNIVRGFQAFETFLHDRSVWHGKVRFLALLPRSRIEIPEYQVYWERVPRRRARMINAKFGGAGWEPVEMRTEENYARRSRRSGIYDALLVNPVFDGMNLVAMEGPLVNRTHGSLILSQNAGAFARLGRHALAVNPFDVAETAEAIGRGARRCRRGTAGPACSRADARGARAEPGALADGATARSRSRKGISAAASQAAQEHEERRRAPAPDTSATSTSSRGRP